MVVYLWFINHFIKMEKECGRKAAFLGHVRQGYRICRSDPSISFAFAFEFLLAPSQGTRYCWTPVNESMSLSQQLDSLTWHHHDFSTKSRVPIKAGMQEKVLVSDSKHQYKQMQLEITTNIQHNVSLYLWDGLNQICHGNYLLGLVLWILTRSYIIYKRKDCMAIARGNSRPLQIKLGASLLF